MGKSITIRDEDFFRVFLILWLIGSIISCILQLFFSSLVADSSIWVYSDGWQREIGLWNVGIIFGIVCALFLNSSEINKFLTLILVGISMALGTNHLISLILIQRIELINIFGAIMNYFAVVFGAYSIYINRKDFFK